MRRRLIQSTLAVVLVVIAVFGVSLVIVETRTISSTAQERVESEAVRLASIVDSRLLATGAVTADMLSDQVPEDRYAVIRVPGERPIAIGEKPDGDTSTLREQPVTDTGKGYADASEDFRFAAAVASFAMLLRDSPFKGNATFAAVQELADAARKADPGGYRAEFLELVRQAKTLSGKP